MNLLLLDESELQAGNRAALSGRRAEHVRDVLRAAPGQALRVGIRGGRTGQAVVQGWADEVLLLEDVRCTVEPPPRAGVHLLLAMPRPKALRRILPAVASLGVDEVVLVNAARVERSYLDSPVLTAHSVQRLFDQGLEQAEDTRAPVLSLETRFRPFVEDVLPARVQGAVERWLLHPDARPGPPPASPTVPPPGVSASEKRWLAIGPETGWTDFERELLAARGFTPVSLGARILRVETVVPYAIGRLCPALTAR